MSIQHSRSGRRSGARRMSMSCRHGVGLAHGRRGSFGALALSLALALLLAVALASAPAGAAPPADAGASPANPEQVSPNSPRAALKLFLDATRAGEYQAAARHLALPAEDSARGPELARRLKAVLDRHLWIELETISGLANGNRNDGLPPLVERVGDVPSAGGGSEPVLLRRDPRLSRWQFAPATVQRIEAWYERLEGRWFIEHLPRVLLRPGPRDLLWWQWLALPLLLLMASALGSLLSRLSRNLIARAVSRTSVTWDDAIAERVVGPLTVGWALALTYVFLPSLGLYEPAEEFLRRCLSALVFAVFFWALARIIDVVRQVIAASPWAQGRAATRSLLPLAARVAKVLLAAIAVVALLSELGYPVASLVAGLGIGGVAVALGAQKTLENLFGAFSIGADQPFCEGDFVRVEDFVGTVEAIGLRSTRIRTLDRTLISMPNGKLADMRIESFAVRDRLRLACNIGLVYSTTAAQMRAILEGLEAVLRAHPKIWTDAVIVRFSAFGDSSLNIEVMAWFQTTDWGEFLVIRQDVLIQFMEVVEREGSSFAFPTRTLHLVNEKA